MPTVPRRAVPRFETLADYLDATGATQAALAARSGTSQAHISRIVAGHTVPRPALAARLAAVASVPLESFMRVYLTTNGDRP